ncbi:hypothetical protein B9Z55_015341 [Caenorhabditis nigoni]|uniref:Saposin B-type domain-containing protein n=1 Tax=Caenorhabditis nigoni TaxID=1611254 RepID=A0A2G5U9T6_9PELO|nr:hypothetical protein B9Z55_015341 [Caenorhabditis nigoni]
MEKVENDVETFWSGLIMENNIGQVLAMSCFECKFLVEDMGTDMISNRKKLSDDVRDFACYKIVTANMTASCIDFLDLYLPTVIQMTIEQFTPLGICQANKCCPPNSDEALRAFTYQEIQAEKCPTMKSLESYVASNIIGSPIEKYFENSLTDIICSHSISLFQPTCQRIMSAVAPRFASLTAVLASENKFSQALVAISCLKCKFLVEDVRTDMISNRKKLSDDVRDFACYKIVTANMTPSCIDFLDLYLPTVIQMTIEQFTPLGICQANKCCPPNSEELLRAFTYQEIQAEKCPTMKSLESYVASNIIGSPIEKYFENSLTYTICSHLISLFQPTCQRIMSAVAPRLASLTAVR